MTDATSGDVLPCGAGVDALLDQIAAGRADDRDAHQGQCPHCQAALAEYDRLWAPVRELAASEVRPPDGIMEAALRRIRGTAAEPDYGVIPGPRGTTRVSARVVIVTARETAQAVAGVRVALGNLVTAGVTPVADDDGATNQTPDPAEPAAADHAENTEPVVREEGTRVVAGMAGRSTAIEVTLAADYGVDLVDLGARIRAEVAARVSELTGLEPVAVTVRIDDVFD